MRAFILMAAVCVAVTGCNKEAPKTTDTRAVRAAPPPPSAPFDGKTRQDFGDFSFVVPEGWVTVTPELDMTKALIMLGGADWPGAKAMIKVDTQTPNVAEPKDMISVFASNTAGTVLPDPVDFDGTPGARGDASPDFNTSQRHLLAVFRDGVAYSVTINSETGVALDAAIELVRSSWKWKNAARSSDEGKAVEGKAEEKAGDGE